MPTIVYDEISSVISEQIYPIVAKSLSTNSNRFLSNINKFINNNHEQLFDVAPYDRIYYTQKDLDDMFDSLKLKEKDIENIMQATFFWNQPYNPQCAKEPYVMVLMMAIRYYLKNNQRKNAEITTIYLAFSGKFYSSLHGAAFPTAPPSRNKSVMDYVVNNMLSDKFDLKKEGSVFGAIKSLCITWINTYEKKGVKDQYGIANDKTNDDGLGKLVQQLRDRVKSFLMNIAKLYYEAKDKKLYLNYETDNYDSDNFRLTDSDATLAARITENTMNYLTSNYVSLDICNKCKDENVKATEIKDIIECILGNNDNLDQVRRVVNILICDFLRSNPGKRVDGIDFVAYSIKMKPNTKDPYLLEMKDIIFKWLDENSPAYRKRKSRKATQMSYYKSILMYFILVINKVAKQ